jgi:hypothetical protein
MQDFAERYTPRGELDRNSSLHNSNNRWRTCMLGAKLLLVYTEAGGKVSSEL